MIIKKVDYNDYVGTKINKLTIKSFYRSSNSKVYFVCECDCGNKKNIEARHVLSGATRSCGCLLKEVSRKKAKKMGLSSRKYEEKCTLCGKNEHYAKSYCTACYHRFLRKGTPKYCDRELLHKKNIPLTEEQITKALDIIYTFQYSLTKSNTISYDSINRYRKGKIPTIKMIKRCFNYLGLDIFKELNIDDKYKDKKIYNVE